mmetsp:Transcript_21147/g.36030  ORF Transcript_21147/g.36030 Transcript_21147/m.36030 type:complete len:334 (+) Transcript_21147:65-1066(+)
MAELLTPTTYSVEIPNPKAEEWKGVQRSATLNYKLLPADLPITGIKAAVAAAKGDTKSVPRYIDLTQGVLTVASGPNFQPPGNHETICTINIKGCTIKNKSAGVDHKFVIKTTNGDDHVFKCPDKQILSDWLIDLECVFRGVHAPPPEKVRLFVSDAGLAVLKPDVDEEIALYPYERVKDFKCLSERTVMIIVQPPKKAADVETYYRSLEGRGREIVALITAFVKDAVLRRQREQEERDNARKTPRSRHRSKSSHKHSHSSSSSSHKKGKSSRHRKKGGSRRTSAQNSSESSTGSESYSGELHPDWKEAVAPNGKTYYYHVETKETTWQKPVV